MQPLSSVVIYTVPVGKWFVASQFKGLSGGDLGNDITVVEDDGGALTVKMGWSYQRDTADGTPLGHVFVPGSQVRLTNISTSSPWTLRYHVEGYLVDV